MTDNFSKIYEKLQRKHLRQNMHRVWKTAQSGEIDKLSDEDYKLLVIMQGHEQFHDQFDNADALAEYEYDPETEVNPFLHIAIHQMVEDQIASNEPMEASLFLEAMEDKGHSRHDILHLISMILIQITCHTLLKQKPFDELRYRQILKSYINLTPEEIPEALDSEFKG